MDLELDPANPLTIELRHEMAGTYFAELRKMGAALDELKTFDAVSWPKAFQAEQAARREELLAEAAERVYFVVIQREAMRLSGYDDFFRHYQIPDEVRARMGPKRLG